MLRKALAVSGALALLGGFIFSNGAVASETSSQLSDKRLSGERPSQTAVAVAESTFVKPETVYLAPEKSVVNAYAAASQQDGPIFAVPKKRLPEAVGTYIQQVTPERVVLLGQADQFSETLVDELAANSKVVRVEGQSQTEISLELAKTTYPSPDRVYLVDGYLTSAVPSPDAVAAGARQDGPVILLPAHQDMPTDVAKYISGAKEVIQVGAKPFGNQEVSDLRAGRDRITTATEVQSGEVGGKIYLAKANSVAGFNAALNVNDGSVLLARDQLPAEVCAHIYFRQPEEIVAIGNTDELKDSVLEQANECLTKGWETSGYEMREISEDFYDSELMSYTTHEDRAVCDKMMTLDGVHMCAPDGVRIIRVDGEEAYNYTSISQLALYNISQYKKTGTERFLQRAVTQAEAIIDLSEMRGEEMWLPYDYNFALNGEKAFTIKAPWFSGMAQGQALSVFSRLAMLQPDVTKWAETRDALFATFKQIDRYPEPFSLSFSNDYYMWFEEFAGSTPPLMVPNGHMFAIFGLYDYWESTKDSQAQELLDAGLTTIRDAYGIYRNPGEMSSYCTYMPRCRPIQHVKYHAIHAMQLHFLYLMTGDEEFERQSEELFADFHEIDEESGWGLVW
ncbi:MAG: D-glucuronyl C5-epimerase family protein [Actinomycetaceae bacterium]|nr:D-glucuronyl C5-epimerase family protein [Actinomycetaceae bacterium]